jgi:hypothetical protein
MLPAIDSDILRELHRLHVNVIRDYERYGLGGHVPEPIRDLYQRTRNEYAELLERVSVIGGR